MEKFIITVIMGLCAFQVKAFDSEIKEISLLDGEKIEARLCLPKEAVKTIVFTVHGTGPYTYLTKRAGFNYYDVLAEGFCEQGVGFLAIIEEA